MNLKLLTTAMVLAANASASAAAQAQTSSVFNLTSGSFANAYTFTVTGPSSVMGDTQSSGVTWFGVLLQSPTVPYTALDSNPDDGFTFTGLSAGTYALTFLGSGTGGYGGYYTVITQVPEPETYKLMLAGLAVGGFVVLRRRNG